MATRRPAHSTRPDGRTLVKTADFDYRLPPERIAQQPPEERDASRLLVVKRRTGQLEDRTVKELPQLLRPGDLLVFNNTRVVPARLRATRAATGGRVEIFLLPTPPTPPASPDSTAATTGRTSPPESSEPGKKPAKTTRRLVFTKSGGKLLPDEILMLPEGLRAVLRERRGEAGDVVEFALGPEEFAAFVERHGEVPLPPYIKRPPGPSAQLDRKRYQTVYAAVPGAVAAPTAGFHFSPELLDALARGGVASAFLTLHVGPGTFRPVKVERIDDHYVAPEPFLLPEETAAAVARAKQEGRRVIPVGTTALRVLESRWDKERRAPRPGYGSVSLYIRPPFRFHAADALLTNFHLPKSSLLILVAAFAAPETVNGIEAVKNAYAHALDTGYRFYSYGDACLFE